jgi:hypothetical protein
MTIDFVDITKKFHEMNDDLCERMDTSECGRIVSGADKHELADFIEEHVCSHYRKAAKDFYKPYPDPIMTEATEATVKQDLKVCGP